ncbi:MAG TPA: acetate--CoA ligase family protein, partial [Solirubrobacteraceae bacterium]|nr:acetate--CoA ligase family protein [Solirubrobacteraceae bacterium]
MARALVAEGGAAGSSAATTGLDLSPLLRPRSVAVVGASDRPGSYGDATLRNLAALGFAGPVWGVHPTRREVHGHPCVPTLEDLLEPVDAVVVAIPAAGVPEVARAAGRRGCGGLVVFAAGFAEAGGAALQAELADAAAAFGLPVIGPNCDGLVAFHARAALWGDALVPRPAGRVALISQSGNVAVNALALGRGLRFHTVASVGNQAVLDAATLLHALVDDDEVGSVALFLESDGDGARLAAGLARAAERDVGVAVLKVGATAAGATAAAAHTGALAGDQRVFRAFVEEAGAAWADDVHDLLELAKALAVPGARTRAARPVPPASGLAVLTCSGGDSGLAADEAGRLGIPLATLGDATAARLEPLLPDAATVANPLDYTAMIWGERERLAEIVRVVADDPAVDQLLLFYDEPPGMEAGLRASWDAVREGLADGAADAAVPALVAATLPELLQDDSAAAYLDRGVPAIAGLRTALACAAALRQPPGDPTRLHAIAAAAAPRADYAAEWLSEADAKALLRSAGIAVPAGRPVAGEDDAVRAARELGGPVAIKASAAALQHKSEAGALALGVAGDAAVRAAYRRVAAAGRRAAGSDHRAGRGDAVDVLVEAMAEPGVELLVAARRDAVVPALVVGLGGVWTELLDDVAIVPLPASPVRVEAALRSLRGAGVLIGGRGSAPVDLTAVAALAAACGDLLLARDLA